ncbi:N-6 DNA methylase (plasmid) [Rhodococcus aetherivorans]|uniref:N-6 DNA methylase n=1 Tax=Rhodococcus aetherivorans TaxID=191292 RepID=UPI0031DE695A
MMSAALMNRLISRDSVRTEATVQSDVRLVLLEPDLGLAEHELEVALETQIGDKRRIDVEVGCTVIEVKKDLRSPSVLARAAEQLAGYVTARTEQVGQRYVGMLTDGALWIAYTEVDGRLVEATRHTAAPGEAGGEALLIWLEGVLATRQGVIPQPSEIAQRLGADSSSHALDFATLAALYAESRNLPTVQLKRELWSSLLKSALGTQFTDSDELFLEHTLLVNSAEIIAHLVLGVDARQLSPATLLEGSQFELAGIRGVVDRDFFDWVLEVDGGAGYVRALARRLTRFDWSAVEHDVLKVLYESVIKAETRKSLGEYYTPDWLAEATVSKAVSDPLHQRVLDPACGSGSFVFYAVRRFLQAADDAGWSLADTTRKVSSQVAGIDLHPVAVALARVTYLLAIGRERLTAPGRGDVSVPVYLGDSIGWSQTSELLSGDDLVVPTDTGDMLWSGELRFPGHLLTDAARFDDLVITMTNEAGRAAGKSTVSLSQGTVRRLALTESDVRGLNANFVRLKELHEQGRDHVWSYFIRNMARPEWLGRPENRVDVLVGNPPWLSYRYMPARMQAAFKMLSQDRGLWKGGSTTTHLDLAALFVARAIQRYLKTNGILAFVVPNPVIDRDYWAAFRSGKLGTGVEVVNVAWESPWDLRRLRPHFFPRGASVVFGRRSHAAATMPGEAEIWSGRIPKGKHTWVDVAPALNRTSSSVAVSSKDQLRSPYSSSFAQGASIVPRVLFMVEPAPVSVLGVAAGRQAVRSMRSSTEKKPWKDLEPLSGTVESEFVRPVLLGESVLPFRVLSARKAVLPIVDNVLMDGDSERIDGYPGLATWVRETEHVWMTNRSSDKMSLREQLDFRRKLTQQFPVPPIRVVYAKAGMHVAAAVVTDQRAIIDHTLYWGSMSSLNEAKFLVSVLNAPSLTEMTRPLMSYGKDERHIDKHVWKLPIPKYDPENEIHVAIVASGEELSEEISQLSFESDYFITQRQAVRRQIASTNIGKKLDEAVRELLSPGTG